MQSVSTVRDSWNSSLRICVHPWLALPHLLKKGFGIGDVLFLGVVVLVRGDGPLMAERVFHHAVAVAPEHIGDGHLHGATGLDRAVKGGVRIREVDMEEDARAA